MEEGKLGEAASRPKLTQGPCFQVRKRERFFSFRKIELAKEPGDPDIDGEGVPPAVGIQEDAAGDFGTDSGQLLEMFGGLFR